LAWLIKKKERAGKKISWIIVRQKRVCIFSAEDVAKMYGKGAMKGKKSKKG
jgi:hypothetical protein